MHFLFAVILAVSLSMTGATAQNAKQDERPDPEPKSFKEAYAGYNAAVKKGETHLLTLYAEHAYKLGKEKYGEDNINTINLALNWLNAFSAHSNGHNTPEKTLQKSFPKFKKLAKKNPLKLIQINMSYGRYLVSQRSMQKKSESMKYFDRAIRISKGISDAELTYAVISLEVGKTLSSYYNIPKVQKNLTIAQKIFAKTPEKNRVDLAVTNFWLAKSYLSSKKYTKAAGTMSTALKILDEHAPSTQLALSGHAFMVQILEKQGKSDEATLHCQKIGQAKPMDVNQEQIPLYRFQAKYPRTSKEGYVTLEFTVDDEGFVKNPKAIDGENMEKFSEAAMDAVVGFRYAPRFKDGKPVSTDGLKTRFTFKRYKQ